MVFSFTQQRGSREKGKAGREKCTPTSHRNLEVWDRCGSNMPWELSEPSGEISELPVRESAKLRTGRSVYRCPADGRVGFIFNNSCYWVLVSVSRESPYNRPFSQKFQLQQALPPPHCHRLRTKPSKHRALRNTLNT